MSRLSTWDDVEVQVDVECEQDHPRAGLDITFGTTRDERVLAVASHLVTDDPLPLRRGRNVMAMSIKRLPLAAGSFVVSIGVSHPMIHYHYYHPCFATMEVRPRTVHGAKHPIECKTSPVVVDASVRSYPCQQAAQ